MKYFDYAASTPINNEVLEVYQEISKKYFIEPGKTKETQELYNQYQNNIKEKLKATTIILNLQQEEVKLIP